MCRVGIIDLRELFRGTAVTESQPGGFLALAPVECRIWLLELQEENLPHRQERWTQRPSYTSRFLENNNINHGKEKTTSLELLQFYVRQVPVLGVTGLHRKVKRSKK